MKSYCRGHAFRSERKLWTISFYIFNFFAFCHRVCFAQIFYLQLLLYKLSDNFFNVSWENLNIPWYVGSNIISMEALIFTDYLFWLQMACFTFCSVSPTAWQWLPWNQGPSTGREEKLFFLKLNIMFILNAQPRFIKHYSQNNWNSCLKWSIINILW